MSNFGMQAANFASHEPCIDLTSYNIILTKVVILYTQAEKGMWKSTLMLPGIEPRSLA
ncbi:MAG: hypothetical protein MJE68_29455 [Proteobacteria bacterium]|nr:hypothetical protein [Pseudomonadota bacterium]